VPLIDWVTGATISESNLDAVARQVVITCTSTTRPASPDEGMTIFETDTDRVLLWNGSAWVIVTEPWQAYTPVLTATTTSPTLGTGSTASARYQRQYNLVTYQGIVQFGTAGVAAGTGDYRLSLPVTAQTGITNRRVGIANSYDSSAAHTSISTVYLASSTTVGFLFSNTWPLGNLTYVGAAQPMAWAASDALEFTITYEAA
jgi:hypothetical protein